jgi:hypothetical protein
MNELLLNQSIWTALLTASAAAAAVEVGCICWVTL